MPEAIQGALARVLVNVRDDVEGEVEDALEVARADVGLEWWMSLRRSRLIAGRSPAARSGCSPRRQ